MAKRLFWSAVALLALGGTLRADVPPGPTPHRDIVPAPNPLPGPPRPDVRLPDDPLPPLPPELARPKENRSRLVIRFDGPDTQPRLRLPSALVKDLPAESPPVRRGAWLTPSRPALVAGGLALTLSVATAGLWLTRGGRRRLAGGAGLLLVGVAILGVSGCPWNEDARPNVYEEAVSPLTCAEDTLVGKLLLERDDRLDTVQLLLGREELTTFADRAAAPKSPLTGKE
jgi:hypothetical protein